MFIKLLKCFFVLSFVLAVQVKLFALSYKITDLHHPDSKIGYVASLNELGQVAGICVYKRKNFLFQWDEHNGFTFIQESGGYDNNPKGPPFLNDEGIISMMPITNTGDKYFINDKKKLCKVSNGEIEESLEWCSQYNLRVNNSGQILGNIQTVSGKITIVIYNEIEKSITNIYPSCKYNLYAVDINDRGWVISYYHDLDGFQGFLWTPEFGILYLGNFRPTAINNHGCIVGTQNNRAVIWNEGKLIDLSKELKIHEDPTTTLLWISCISDINDSGQMIGWGQNSTLSMMPDQTFLLTPRE